MSLKNLTKRIGNIQMTLEKIFGGSPLHVIGRLLLISLIVGAALSFLGWDLGDLFSSIFSFINGIWQHGWESVEQLLIYAAKGAILVVPIWLITRLFGSKRDN